MSRFRSAPVLAALIFASVAAKSEAQVPADSADVASPEAIVVATYKALDRPPGEPFDWGRFRSLFLPEATLIPNTEQTGGTFRVHSPEGFIAWIDASYAEHAPIGSEKDKGFTEEAVHNEVHRYGDVAQVFSTYQKRFWDDDQVLGRGINSFQLVHHDGRWWIASLAWDEETGAGPIPAAAYGG